MRVPWSVSRRPDYLSDALALLDGWTRQGREIHRALPLDDSQHAALTERITVLADVLAGMLPTGSKLVLHWRDAHGQSGLSAVAGTSEALREQAVAALEGCGEGRQRSRGGADIVDVWEEAGLRIAVAARSKARCRQMSRPLYTP